MVLSRSSKISPNCGKHGGQIVDVIWCADIVTSVVELSVVTKSMARYQKFPSGISVGLNPTRLKSYVLPVSSTLLKQIAWLLYAIASIFVP